MTAGAQPLCLTERALAQEIGFSVSWLRKDRRTKRLLPFYRLGDGPRAPVRYNLQRVKAALDERLEEGGCATRAGMRSRRRDA